MIKALLKQASGMDCTHIRDRSVNTTMRLHAQGTAPFCLLGRMYASKAELLTQGAEHLVVNSQTFRAILHPHENPAMLAALELVAELESKRGPTGALEQSKSGGHVTTAGAVSAMVGLYELMSKNA